MRCTKPGIIVMHNERKGYVEMLTANGKSAVVRFPRPDGFPFPSMETIKLSELKRLRPVTVEEQFEEALF